MTMTRPIPKWMEDQHRESLIKYYVKDVCVFAWLAGEFGEDTTVERVVRDKLCALTGTEIVEMFSPLYKNVDFAEEVLEEMGLSLRNW